MYNRSKIVFDDMACDWKMKLIAQDWKAFYPDATEDIPLDMPEACGNSVQINTVVDADHAGNKATRRSHTWILIFINRAPTVWYSKCQNIVETSTFGSEFVARRIATELIKSLGTR